MNSSEEMKSLLKDLENGFQDSNAHVSEDLKRIETYFEILLFRKKKKMVKTIDGYGQEAQ